MKNKKKDFINLLEDLCFIYNDYIDKYDNSRLEVLIENNMINMYLYKDENIVDQFGLAFNHKEKDSYMYISVVLMKILFGSSIINNKDNLFFNYVDKPNLKMIVNDEDMIDRMFMMAAIHRDIDFYDKLDYGHKIRNKINRMRTASYLDERVHLTKALLKNRSI